MFLAMVHKRGGVVLLLAFGVNKFIFIFAYHVVLFCLVNSLI